MKKKMAESEVRSLVASLLARGHKDRAAKILWPWMVQNEWTDLIWKNIEENNYLAVMGHGSASKTFTSAAWFLLDWWTHPEETSLIITSATIDSMKMRVWSDIKALWSKSEVRMPGILVDSRRILQYSPLDQKNAVVGIAAESDDAQSKIQGIHTKRVRVIVDEADNKLSRSIWSALSNLGTSGDLKVVALANPADRTNDFGQHCEPVDGWTSINPEVDFEWQSRMGWKVLRLDGLKSPNIVCGHDKFPFLLTNKGLEQIRDNKGTNSPEWWCYVRAWYAPEGSIRTVFSSDIWDKIQNKIIWYGETIPIGFCDPAFEGGDNCSLCLGRMGRLAKEPRKTAIEVQGFINIKRQDTSKPLVHDFGEQIISNCKAHGIKPENFGMDCTGNALLLGDYISHSWGQIIQVQFGGAVTDMKITGEDSKKASDCYDRFVTELWHCGREWSKAGLVGILNAPRQLRVQLESRTYDLIPKSQKIRVETKENMKGRGLGSPDEGDSFNGLIHVARIRSNGFMPAVFPSKTLDPMKGFRKNAKLWNEDYGIKAA